jgi:hypothetical protein
MKRLPIGLVFLLAAGGIACQGQVPPEKAADAAAAPADGVLPAESAPASSQEALAAPVAPAPAAPPPATRSDPYPPAPAPGSEPYGSAPAPPDPPAPAEAVQPADDPTPALTSNPLPEPRVLAAGTVLPLVLGATVASNTSQVGDRVMATLAEDISEDGRVLLPAGTEVLGRVTVAQRSGRVKGRARLVMEFDEVRDGGSSYRVEASPVDVTAESSKGKDAKIAGGAAAAGAVIGAITGGGKGALKGTAIGGAAGGAAVLATRGKEVELESGTRVTVKLTSKAQID